MANRKLPSGTACVPALVPEQIDRSILVVRGQKVLLDEQLAAFYGVETRALVQAVKRNINRFPEDFILRLTGDEWAAMRPQVATSSLRSQAVILKAGRGQYRKYLPYAFTEQSASTPKSQARTDGSPGVVRFHACLWGVDAGHSSWCTRGQDCCFLEISRPAANASAGISNAL